MSPRIAVFDLDETLICGDSSQLWTQYLWEKKIITDPCFIEADQQMMTDYHAGKLDMHKYLAFSLQALHQVPHEQVDIWLSDFVDNKIRPLLYPAARRQLEIYRQQHVPIIIISATVAFVVKKIAAAFGVQTALGIDMIMENGCYTGKIQGTPTFRDGKVIRLQQWLTEQNLLPQHILFYTDSANDLPMCLFANEIFTVNPDKHLQTIASTHGWKQLNWTLEQSLFEIEGNRSDKVQN
ncbi:HAD family hydrolase [Xenorhabdus szentirmaii]|uniref:Hydrolase, haloacid dehalogenase-like family n=1 Tax=Xenorhabdus szentirmaii DSM 16338 TaxID=1427518 RepID=W1IZD8_9GAMM|nr:MULTISPECIES: HAD family hydrolase [Xenorhabdus]MBD2790896.1 HAD-IB family hydrolase [Xenorhabdus sp. CUL]PHM34792.1 bifunctional L-3-phosphoserine phosphatase/1-acyl-sn-glycerol-3-phosphate acyltransferase [Xenorhabdus szentirmaii DSM 16338]CDL82971.1 putative hydrolase, haloacid dehalogenase-like family [Xenorhabdus szentirmaii DSM 16338]